MKHKGSTTDYLRQRDDALMKAYRDALRAADTAAPYNYPDICRRVADSPSPRFWVSEERAAAVIGAIENGKPLPPMRGARREMFAEIHRRYLKEKAADPGGTVFALAVKIVNSPAPKFYLTPLTVGDFIQRIKKRRRQDAIHRRQTT